MHRHYRQKRETSSLHRAGKDDNLSPVLAGSHLDSQPTGGKFDGVYGVLAALEAIETLNDEGITTLRPVEIVSWTNEEGARFAPGLTGSGVYAGVFRPGIRLNQRRTRMVSPWARSCSGSDTLGRRQLAASRSEPLLKPISNRVPSWKRRGSRLAW